ncbi:MAG: type I-B CRISPR-associated endonuclease Cas1b [Thermoprotei archaeon]
MKKDLYIFSSGELKREGNTLCFINEKGKRFIPISDIASILIFGEISFNKRLLEFLSSNEILLHFYNYYGYYVGSFYPRSHYNSGFMILKQAEHYMNHEKRIQLAKKFVQGSLKNMIRNLKYYESREGGLMLSINTLEDYLSKLSNVKTIEELMAIEGNSREEYYKTFNIIIKDPNFHYEKREKKPPKSRLDSLISFGNGLLYTTVLGEIYKTHLDPRIGFLHTTNFRKFSLNLDVAEIFKPLIVDRIIFTLINKNMLDENSFMRELDGLYLNQKGKSIFIQEYDKKLKQPVKLKSSLKRSYRRIIRIELYKIEKHLIGEQEYIPFMSRW